MGSQEIRFVEVDAIFVDVFGNRTPTKVMALGDRTGIPHRAKHGKGQAWYEIVNGSSPPTYREIAGSEDVVPS